jgi:hypothetical protein
MRLLHGIFIPSVSRFSDEMCPVSVLYYEFAEGSMAKHRACTTREAWAEEA